MATGSGRAAIFHLHLNRVEKASLYYLLRMRNGILPAVDNCDGAIVLFELLLRLTPMAMKSLFEHLFHIAELEIIMQIVYILFKRHV